MSTTENNLQQAADEGHSLLSVVVIALAAGAAIGCVGTIFRVALERADRLRDAMFAWAHGRHLGIPDRRGDMCNRCVRRRRFSPHASGSGIPHVEAVLHEQIPPAPFSLVLEHNPDYSS